MIDEYTEAQKAAALARAAAEREANPTATDIDGWLINQSVDHLEALAARAKADSLDRKQWPIMSIEERRASRAHNELARRARVAAKEAAAAAEAAAKAEATSVATAARRNEIRARIVAHGGHALTPEALERLIDEEIVADVKALLERERQARQARLND